MNFKRTPLIDDSNDDESFNLVFENFDTENIVEPFKEAIDNLKKSLKKPETFENIKLIP